MSERTLLDIGRVGTEASWPAIASEVNGYLEPWLAAANAQVSEHELRLITTSNPAPGPDEPCGWEIDAALDLLTPGGDQALSRLRVMFTGADLWLSALIGNSEPHLGSTGGDGASGGSIFPSRSMNAARGIWSTAPLPFNGQVGWSLAPGAEYFVFSYSQHVYSDRQAVPLLIAREQRSGLWILGAIPAWTTGQDPEQRGGLRAVCWEQSTGQCCGSRGLIRDTQALGAVRIRRPAELALSTSNWTQTVWTSIPSLRWGPQILPPDFAATNATSAAQSYYIAGDGSEWLALGGQGLLLLIREGSGSAAATPPAGGDG